VQEINLFSISERTLGEAVFSARELFNETQEVAFKLLRGKRPTGTIRIVRLQKIMQQYTFLNHVYGGAQVKIVAGIDFSTGLGKHAESESA